jgi:hypothetical protein
VEFDSLDRELVDIVALILTPPERPGQHLGRASRGSEGLVRRLSDEAFCRRLRQARSAAEIEDLLLAVDGGMTRGEWATCTDPGPMLRLLRERKLFTERKARLFAAACGRRLWGLLPEEGRVAVEVVERDADGLVSREERDAIRTAFTGGLGEGSGLAFFATAAVAYLLAEAAPDPAGYALDLSPWVAQAGELASQADILRCLFGPRRSGRWRSSRSGCGSATGSCRSWLTASTTRVRSTAWRSWRTPWRKPASATSGYSATSAAPPPTSAAATVSTSCWGRTDAMTEDTWLAGSDPQPMLDFLGGKASDRKLRLLAVACFDHLHRQAGNENDRVVIELGERYADGSASDMQRQQTWEAIDLAKWEAVNSQDFEQAARLWARQWLVIREMASRSGLVGLALSVTEGEAIARIRCIFGNPFRPARIDPPSLGWNDGTVVKLAGAIYDERAFDRLPILADALEEAGCSNAAILGHLRGPGPHCRGCFVLDAILGKE